MPMPAIRKSLSAFLLAIVSLPAIAASDYWTVSDKVDRRTCPSAKCGLVGQLFFREKVTVLETRNGWGRISRPYSASCWNGRSDYIDNGNSACTPENGIVDGKFSEWIRLEQVSKTQPADPGGSATGIAALISSSDHYRFHTKAFIKAAETLLAQKKCTENDFKESGGWVKSRGHYRTRPVYLLYCGGWDRNNRIYLDASNGRIFREIAYAELKIPR